MNILAFDTCLFSASAAYDVPGEPLRYRERTKGDHRNEDLLRLLGEVMAVDWGRHWQGYVDLLAVTIGPGSFTGARVGVAAALGMVTALAVPMVTLSSLETAAFAQRRYNGPFAVAFTASRRSVYYQAFFADGSHIRPRSEAAEVEAAAVCRYHDRDPLPFFCEREETAALVGVAGYTVSPPRADVMVELARQRAAAGETADPSLVVPYYLKRSSAEENAEKSFHAEE